MSLVTFLNRYGQIQIIEDTEKTTPFYTEVSFRVLDNEFWNNCLEKLTRAFPEVYFVKRYITKGDKFGFQWLMILWGQRDKEQLEQFCEEADSIVGTSFVKKTPPKEVPKKNKNDTTFHLGTKKIFNEKGDEIGEVRRTRLAGISNEENTLNEINHKDAPLVLSGSMEKVTSQILRRLGR